MKRVVLLAVIAVMTSGCGVTTLSGKDILRGVNTAMKVSKITKAGVKEDASNCIKDIFDPGNRGSGC